MIATVTLENIRTVAPPDERWKMIDKYPPYQVSNYGRVKRKLGNGKEHILAPIPIKGYWRYQFSSGGKSYHKQIHRIVYETFVAPIPDGYEIDHLDHNRENNHVSNLEIITKTENRKRRRYSRNEALCDFLHRHFDTLVTRPVMDVICSAVRTFLHY